MLRFGAIQTTNHLWVLFVIMQFKKNVYFLLYSLHGTLKENNYNDFQIQSLNSIGILYNYTQSISRNGEGNGTPLQYSCLENPMDGGAW